MKRLLGMGAALLLAAPFNAAYADNASRLTSMAQGALAACRTKGYAVTVSAVGMDGQPIVVLRADGAPIHTVLNSFDKAYTVMTLGPLKHLDSSGALANAYRQTPASSFAIPQEPLPHIIFNAGAVLVALSNNMVAGLGVSGSATGDIDEDCARKGLAAGK